ncbi:endothelin-converting enzyme 1-like [Elysia marginata]|uniref:Endothelin-converting enzyme 1-like n=1 Tax=Elysia marginata TaxID=1093978 RepID=A0AAV4JR17_9GAST|nr:endothelin-converting enzyme 1-like [Elysia marginata]
MELAVRAGILQFPIYDGKQPHTSSFGSLGVLIGCLLNLSVNRVGSFYDLNGQKRWTDAGSPVSWWSNVTIRNYEINQKCIKDVHSNLTQTVFDYDKKQWKTFKVTSDPHDYLKRFSLQLTQGSKLSLLGYRDWVKKKGLREGNIPGLNLSKEQMLFLTQAQTFCRAEHADDFLNAAEGYMLQATAVNSALGQVGEFSEVFSCKKNSNMNPAQRCQF